MDTPPLDVNHPDTGCAALTASLKHKAIIDVNHPDTGGAALTRTLEALLEGALATKLINCPDDGIFCLISVAQRLAINTQGKGREEEALHLVQQTLASLEDAHIASIRKGEIIGKSRGGFERKCG